MFVKQTSTFFGFTRTPIFTLLDFLISFDCMLLWIVILLQKLAVRIRVKEGNFKY